MPLTINVGLSRKASRNFQSRGTSINVSAELDQSLLAKPQQLQREIQSLYRQAELALQSQTDAMAPVARRITPSQKRALHAIADRLGITIEHEIAALFRCTIDELSIVQASHLIDALKVRQRGIESNGAVNGHPERESPAKGKRGAA
jgi:hypothetical protein